MRGWFCVTNLLVSMPFVFCDVVGAVVGAYFPQIKCAILLCRTYSSVTRSLSVAEGLIGCEFRKLSESVDETVSLPSMGGLGTKEVSVCQNQDCWSRADYTYHALVPRTTINLRMILVEIIVSVATLSPLTRGKVVPVQCRG